MFDEGSLEVTRARSLAGRVNESITAGHGVEEEFLGRHRGEKTVGAHAAGPRTNVVGREGGEGATAEHQGDTTTLQFNLAQGHGHLLGVDLGGELHHLASLGEVSKQLQVGIHKYGGYDTLNRSIGGSVVEPCG